MDRLVLGLAPPGQRLHLIANNARWTYKGERGYMPMVGHLAEAGVVIHDDFRAGNVAPASANLDFVKACESRLPKGHRLAAVRTDSASYQANLFNYCEETGRTFPIGGRLDAPTLAAIAAIPESAWTQYADCAVAETVHSMEVTHKAFRLIVVRYRHQADLLEEDPSRTFARVVTLRSTIWPLERSFLPSTVLLNASGAGCLRPHCAFVSA